MSDVRPIRFHGQDFYLHTFFDENSGPITEGVSLSMDDDGYAFLWEDGKIWRYQEVIGTIDDIVFLDEDHDDA